MRPLSAKDIMNYTETSVLQQAAFIRP